MSGPGSVNGARSSSPITPNRNAFYGRDFGTSGYNACLVWRPSGNDTVRLAARDIGMPSLINLGLIVRTAQISLFGNPSLEPTVVDNYMVGYRRRVTALDASFGIAAYHQVNSSMRSDFQIAPARNPGTAGFSVTPRNLPALQVLGIETSGRGTLGHGFDWVRRVSTGFSFWLVRPGRAIRSEACVATASGLGPAELAGRTLSSRYASALRQHHFG